VTDRLPRNAFARLSSLLEPLTPPTGLAPIALHLGELQFHPPSMLLDNLVSPADWSRYPPLGGTPELRHAYEQWLLGRFGTRTGNLGVEPTPGAKQAMALLITDSVRRKRMQGTAQPVVALPNPFYPTYYAAVSESQAQAEFYDPEPSRVTRSLKEALDRAGPRLCAIIICHPGNPSGDVYDSSVLAKFAAIASDSGAILLVDECYIDTYVDAPPPGYLQLVAQGQVSYRGTAVVHTLSKRSGVPGLRSGFVAGDPALVDGYARVNRTCGVSLAKPVCDAAARLWSDEAHVEANRARLRENWVTADQVMRCVPAYRRPAAGFFLWLRVQDDEAVTRRLWARAALKVMPGRYLGCVDATGGNPGAGHIRVALVHDRPTVELALIRLRDAILEEETNNA